MWSYATQEFQLPGWLKASENARIPALRDSTLKIFYRIRSWSPERCVITWYVYGSGSGTSGGAMAFCLGRPGSNPRSDFGFFQFRIADNLCSLGVVLFLKTCNRMVYTLPSSFLFPIIIFHCENNQIANYFPRERKNNINPKRGRERPI